MACGSINGLSKLLVYQPDGTVHAYDLNNFVGQFVTVPTGSHVAGAYVGFNRTGCPSNYTKYRPFVYVDGSAYVVGGQERAASYSTELWMTINGYNYGGTFTDERQHSFSIGADGWNGSRWEQVKRSPTYQLMAKTPVTSPSFTISGITRTPSTPSVGVNAYVQCEATVTNTGGTGSCQVDWTKNGSRVSTSDVYLQAGTSKTIYFVYSTNGADAGTTVNICAQIR